MTTPDAPHSPLAVPQPRPAAGPDRPVNADTAPVHRPPAPSAVAPPPSTPPEVPAASYAAADAAGVESLLRCWVRETGATRSQDGSLRVPLTATGGALRVCVRYWSPTGHHRFGAVQPETAPAHGCEPESWRMRHENAPMVHENALDAVTLAALLAREASAGADTAAERADLVARVADSVRRTALFVTDRNARPAAPPNTPPFLATEQALVLGHPVHPAPKSREGLSDAETTAYSPETRGSLQLHWLAVDGSVLASDSGWTVGGRQVTAPALTRQLAGPGLRLPEGTAALPVHPWQARSLRERPRVRALFTAGLLHDLGPAGEPWYPTSSVRTLYRPDAPAMLKLSLGVRITNSRRENLRKELLRGAEVHRLLRSPVGRRWREECPDFDIVRDPAWLAVDGPAGTPVPGLDVVLRHVPFGPRDAVGCLAGLTATGPRGTWRSPLAETVLRLAAGTGRPASAVATEWFLRYLDAVVRPVLRLDGLAGIALEAHQQNTLVALDPAGWPRGGWYRDNQGYYFRSSRRVTLEAALPGIGVDSDTYVDDAVADERFAYYLGINNVMGLIGAFGAQRLAREDVLLAGFRRFLATEAVRPDASPLPRILLDSPTLRCKANLLTRLHGLDELVGPVDTQSVYITLTNPLAATTA